MAWNKDFSDSIREIDSKNGKMSVGDWRMLAAVLYWCEGEKGLSSTLTFANSDPAMVSLFLKSLKNGFDVDLGKFRALVHVHEYHDLDEVRAFWSDITGLSENQFHREYVKPHSGTRKRKDYMGCISIRYSDPVVARKVRSLYHALAKKHGGVG
ncbi:MAG: hypothetical protein ABIJ46_03355 [bacterium]